jgi:uncharacterized protein with GYD domain
LSAEAAGRRIDRSQQGGVMAHYVILFNWTDQGIGGFKDSPSRVDAFNEQMSGLGVSVKTIYWTLGPYDLAAVVEGPDDEAITAAMLKLGSGGNVRTTTMRAFDRSEYEALVQRAG